VFEDRSEGEAIMKTWIVVILVVFLVLFVAVATAPGFEKSLSPADVPKCDPATEATHKGTVGRVEDYMRPASGGMGRGATLILVAHLWRLFLPFSNFFTRLQE
jgi:hypothetical protein